MSTIVLDPGHGGKKRVDGSSANNATSASGVLEKDICLDIAKRVKKHLISFGKKQKKKRVKVVMTRDGDENLGLSARANIANENNANYYLSIHCNGFNGDVRGTECWIDRKYMQPKVELLAGSSRVLPGPGEPDSGIRNLNVDQDADFAKLVVDSTLAALKKHDAGAKLRSDSYTKKDNGESYVPPKGVKMMGLGTLRDAKLGTKENNCRAALLELEFIDNPKVDILLNGGDSVKVREDIASEIAKAIIGQL